MNAMPQTIDRSDSLATEMDLVAARYGEGAKLDLADRLPLNETIETMLSHRSVRHYLPTPVVPAELDLILAAAQAAPSSSNLQAWSVVAVEDPDRRARLAALVGNQRHVAQAPLFLVFLADLSRLRAVAVAQGLPSEGLDYLESFVVGVADASFAAQNAVTALESLGLGCCYIGGIRNQPEAVAAELGLPPEAFAVFGLTVGTPDPAVATDIKPRLEPAIVLHRERYQPAASEALARYNVSMNAFQTQQKMRAVDWTRQAAERVRGPEALSGRHVLREVLSRLGFGLR